MGITRKIKNVLKNRFYIDINEKEAQRSLPRLRNYKNRFAGQTIYCIGNGPSLSDENLSLLNGNNLVLTNSGFKILPDCSPAFACAIVQDAWRFQSLHDELKKVSIPVFYSCHEPTMVGKNTKLALPSWIYLKYRWKSDLKYGLPRDLTFDTTFDFSDNIEKTFFGGYSVIFGAIQLAYYMGAKKIVLLGVDMDFSGTKKHFDPTVKHIFPGYDYETLTKQHFIRCREKLAELGVSLVDATTNGKIDVLEKTSLEKLHQTQ